MTDTEYKAIPMESQPPPGMNAGGAPPSQQHQSPQNPQQMGYPPQYWRQKQVEEEPCWDWNCVCLTFLMFLVMGVTFLGVYTYMQGWGWWEDYIRGFRGPDMLHAIEDMDDFHNRIDATALVVILFHRAGCPFFAEITPVLEEMAMHHKGLSVFLTIDLDTVGPSLEPSDYFQSIPQQVIMSVIKTRRPTFAVMCHGEVLQMYQLDNFEKMEQDMSYKFERFCEGKKQEMPGVFGGS